MKKEYNNYQEFLNDLTASDFYKSLNYEQKRDVLNISLCANLTGINQMIKKI